MITIPIWLWIILIPFASCGLVMLAYNIVYNIFRKEKIQDRETIEI